MQSAANFPQYDILHAYNSKWIEILQKSAIFDPNSAFFKQRWLGGLRNVPIFKIFYETQILNPNIQKGLMKVIRGHIIKENDDFQDGIYKLRALPHLCPPKNF